MIGLVLIVAERNIVPTLEGIWSWEFVEPTFKSERPWVRFEPATDVLLVLEEPRFPGNQQLNALQSPEGPAIKVHPAWIDMIADQILRTDGPNARTIRTEQRTMLVRIHESELVFGKRWYVRYTLGGVVREAGPYTFPQASEEKRDIGGFEGVSDVHLTQESLTPPAQDVP